ncbi:MAG: hypothetical protein GXP48_07260 [Acidobacteria bacterium]|nr:hypothetical protein [Acidobacteriota bacterium]
MAHDPMARTGHDPTAAVLRLTARVIGVLAASMWIVIFAASVFHRRTQSFTFESAVLTVLGTWAAAGIAIAFRHELAGGVIAFAAGCAFAVFASLAAGRNVLLAVLVSGGPFLLAGALFAASWYRRRATGRTPG